VSLYSVGPGTPRGQQALPRVHDIEVEAEAFSPKGERT
jgi:hypothetical protein